MCGFTGYVGKNIDKKIIKDMNDMIIHRGPDDSGYYIDNDISMGFRRLSIIDLSHGSQPMKNEDSSMIITFNGEIYNFKELKKELTKKGHKFKNNSDTEVIIHGYEEYKEKIVDKLRGMFAFVIWDKKNKELFGARDYFGIKPFYYYLDNDLFIYGSEIKSFIKHPDFKKEINSEALKTYLTFQYSALDETFFKGVYRLKPGHYFKYKDGNLTVKSYFDYTYEESSKKLDTLIKEINREVSESVRYHKISDVKVGAFLSGGVDSSYIVSLLKPDTTYSVGFNFEGFDETVDAKRLSEILKINNKSKMINCDEFMEGVKKVQYYSDEPHANLSAVPLYYLSRLASDDVKVVLSGEGADELYAGYSEYNQSPMFLKYKKLPFGFRKTIKTIVQKLPKFKGKNFLIRAGSNLEDYYIGQAFIFNDKEANDILTNNYKTNINFKDITKPYFDKVKDKSDVIKMQYLDMNLWLPNDILLKADKMTMANSLELRVPFLDKKVFKQSLNIPTNYKIYENQTKYAFRQASLKTIPTEWSKRRKKGFMVPFSIWLKQENIYREVKRTFESDYSKQFFNVDKITKLLKEHHDGIKNNCRKVYTIYCFLLWYKAYFIDMD
ncbi:MAG: asparagine synthase (glutamine-hydrolyzing) [bacterium]|nr:asparagine synthase (glutamine-hydrolyzing) [bacterium]